VRVPTSANNGNQPADPHGLKDAIQRAGLTQEDVIARTHNNPRGKLAKSTLTNMIRGGRAWPTDETILILGEALNAPHGHWPEYDLARAREQLNPRFVNRAQAIANYGKVCDALGLPAMPSADETAAVELVEAEADRQDETRRELAEPKPRRTRRKGRES